MGFVSAMTITSLGRTVPSDTKHLMSLYHLMVFKTACGAEFLTLKVSKYWGDAQIHLNFLESGLDNGTSLKM